jgi:hypothetical protein
MYVTKEHHEMISGFITVKWRWWFKNQNGRIQKFPPQIQHSTEVNKARKDFLTNNPDGKVLFKDLTK